ncbi:MAG: hypothetical protein M9899_00025 [Bdellovibrionaceae bacterium]|nr:hypothetical protein [Pseudobdellovibrionaceae bacterium]
MNKNTDTLEALAEKRKIQLYDPFAEFLAADETLYRYERSLLDCYRLAGHACHASTGAFLTVEAAILELFPEDHICHRGDVVVEFGSELERAAGPKSQIISYITGAWGDLGFPGLGGNFVRRDLLSFGHKDLAPSLIRFKRQSTGQEVVIDYNPKEILENLNHGLDFPLSWRAEICAILNNSAKALRVCVSGS